MILIERHAGYVCVQELFIRIGKGSVFRQVFFLARMHLELFGMHISHVGMSGGSCGTRHDLFSVIINTETKADQDTAVIFASGDSNILISTLFNIFAVHCHNPSAAGQAG